MFHAKYNFVKNIFAWKHSTHALSKIQHSPINSPTANINWEKITKTENSTLFLACRKWTWRILKELTFALVWKIFRLLIYHFCVRRTVFLLDCVHCDSFSTSYSQMRYECDIVCRVHGSGLGGCCRRQGRTCTEQFAARLTTLKARDVWGWITNTNAHPTKPATHYSLYYCEI